MTDPILEHADALPETIESKEDYELMIETLRAVVEIEKTTESDTAYKNAKALVKDVRTVLKPYEALEESIRARVVAAKVAWEKAVDEAIQMGRFVPEIMEDPPGVSWRRAKRWRLEDGLSAVPTEYVKEVLDESRVKAAVEAGVEVPGIEVYDDYILVVKT